MAALLRMPTVILEPNAKPGFTNRVLRPFVRRAACSYEEARAAFGAKGVVTGNPVRGGFARLAPKVARARRTPCSSSAAARARASQPRRSSPRCPHLPGADRLRIVHQTGPAMRDEVAAALPARPAARAKWWPSSTTWRRAFAPADLVVCRSGATTCAELTVAGKAAVLVPFAQAADDHQRSNARALEAAGAARMVEEKDLTGESPRAARSWRRSETPGRLAAIEDGRARAGPPGRGRARGRPARRGGPRV